MPIPRVMFCALIALIVSSIFIRLSTAEEGGKRYSLEEILSLAEQRNPSLSVFQSNVEAARGALTSARAYPNPEAMVELGTAKPLDPPNADSGREHRLELSQSLEWPGKRASRRRAAEAQVGVARGSLDDFRLELRARVKEAFFQTVLAQHTAQVAAQNLATARSLVESATLRVESGEAPELELIRARVEVFNVTREARRAHNRLLTAQAALNSLLAGALGEIFYVVDAPPRLDAAYELPALIERALAAHPLITRQEHALKAAGYTLSEQRLARVPDLTVTGSTGEEIDKRSSAIGLALAVPLFNQRRGDIAVARAEQTKAQAELAQTRLDLTKEITQEYENYRLAMDQLATFEEGLLKQADEALRIAQLSYEQGELDLLNLLDAQRVQRATLLEYYDAQFELQTSLARLERVTGGLQ
ncbi:MAG: TolC family protein [Nitrospirota bacterium]